MTRRRSPGSGADVLWGRGLRIGLGAMTLIGTVLVGYAAEQAAGTARLEEQLDLATTGLVGLGLIMLAGTTWVLAARGRLLRNRAEVVHRARARLDRDADRHASAVIHQESPRATARKAPVLAATTRPGSGTGVVSVE